MTRFYVCFEAACLVTRFPVKNLRQTDASHLEVLAINIQPAVNVMHGDLGPGE